MGKRISHGLPRHGYHWITQWPLLGKMFNWGDIITKQLSSRIEQAQNPQPSEVPSFYMASYLLDVMCAQMFLLR
jgi:hypothetical protein